MAVVARIGDQTVEAKEYSVSVASTPIDVGDTSGSVGTIELTIPRRSFIDSLRYRDEKITLTDSKRGTVAGYIDDVSHDRSTGITSLRGPLVLRDLNVFDAAARPYVGTLSGAFAYYFSLVGRNPIFRNVPNETLNTRVEFLGWHGELWYHLKMLAAAYGLEFEIVDGQAALRPIRARAATQHSRTAMTASISRNPIAETVEVIFYHTIAVNNSMVYPSTGYSDNLQVLSVNAGETVEIPIQLDVSLNSIEQPIYVESVGMYYSGRSVYTAVGDDGLPITPAAWRGGGGKLDVQISEDDFSIIIVKLTGPKGLPDSEGGELKSFQIAMSSGPSNNRYPALRLRGTGVWWEEKTETFRTGASGAQVETKVGETIDNLFITDLKQVYRAGTRAATRYAGSTLTASGGVIQFSPDWEAQDIDKFGEVAGLRVFDRESQAWYRVRSAQFQRGTVTFDGEDDTTIGDVDEAFSGKTLDQRDATYAGLSLKEQFERGVWNG